MVLSAEFYQRKNVTRIARELLGKTLYTRLNGITTGGMIVETEAYSWKERGCHAYKNRKTPRNEVMFRAGGLAYVYLCYGIHNLFNVVTNVEGMAEAVLIRALEPVGGIGEMVKRTGARTEKRMTSGPGKLTKALGIDRSYNGFNMQSKQLWIVMAVPRIGIDYAGEDALLPWRFLLKDNPWVTTLHGK